MCKTVYIDEADVVINTAGPKRSEDLTGQTFGEYGLCVIGYHELDKWYVRCECGKIFSSKKQHIRNISGCSECARKRKILEYKDKLIGQKFGRLEVLSIYGESIGVELSEYICKCECYNFCTVTGAHLRKGATKSCGCYRSDVARTEIEIGTRFSRLEVLEKLNVVKGCVTYKCRCDCGKICIKKSTYLLQGHTRSCGCLRDEKTAERLKEIQKRNVGKNHYNYDHSVPDEDRGDIRDKHITEELAKKTKDRDNWTCQKCGIRKNLIAHHIHGFLWFKTGRYCIDNLICLCKGCHIDFHSKYTNRNNNLEQLEEYLGFTPKHLIYDPIHLGI